MNSAANLALAAAGPPRSPGSRSLKKERAGGRSMYEAWRIIGGLSYLDDFDAVNAVQRGEVIVLRDHGEVMGGRRCSDP